MHKKQAASPTLLFDKDFIGLGGSAPVGTDLESTCVSLRRLRAPAMDETRGIRTSKG
jgi:hypothetical protein